MTAPNRPPPLTETRLLAVLAEVANLAERGHDLGTIVQRQLRAAPPADAATLRAAAERLGGGRKARGEDAAAALACLYPFSAADGRLVAAAYDAGTLPIALRYLADRQQHRSARGAATLTLWALPCLVAVVGVVAAHIPVVIRGGWLSPSALVLAGAGASVYVGTRWGLANLATLPQPPARGQAESALYDFRRTRTVALVLSAVATALRCKMSRDQALRFAHDSFLAASRREASREPHALWVATLALLSEPERKSVATAQGLEALAKRAGAVAERHLERWREQHLGHATRLRSLLTALMTVLVLAMALLEVNQVWEEVFMSANVLRPDAVESAVDAEAPYRRLPRR